MTQGSTVDLCVLPEGCISNILSLTSPRDACRSSVVSSVFRSSLDSDSVWERFLPSDYQQILSSSISPSPFVFSSKKELYLHLCNNPVLIDNGTKTFALEKCSGKKCYMIGAKALSVVGGDQPEHWCWGPSPDSRFSEVVQLLDICWLEVRGRMETRLLSPSTTYVAYMVFDFTDSAFGFDYYPAEVSVKLAAASSGGEEVKAAYLDRIGRNMRQAANLDPMGKERQQFRQDQVKLQFWIMHRRERMAAADQQLLQNSQVPKEREDGWMEIELGEFFNENGDDGDVEMTFIEIKGGNWKGGLVIEGIELRPKKAI